MLKKLISLIHHNQTILSAETAIRLSLCLSLITLLASTVQFSFAAKPASTNSPFGVLIADEYSNHEWNSTKMLIYGIDVEIASAQTSNFSNPFNGKDLTGWGYLNKNQEDTVFESFDGKNETTDGRFTGKDGILTVNPWDEVKGPHWISIWTKQEYPGDFSMTIEFRAGVNADSGIFIRGKQLQCRDYLVAGPYTELKNYKAQDWNKIEVVVKDNVARCTCNGEVLEEALSLPVTGPLGLEADRGLMEYRNIQIKTL